MIRERRAKVSERHQLVAMVETVKGREEAVLATGNESDDIQWFGRHDWARYTFGADG